jgi:hypothetical protein
MERTIRVKPSTSDEEMEMLDGKKAKEQGKGICLGIYFSPPMGL